MSLNITKPRMVHGYQATVSVTEIGEGAQGLYPAQDTAAIQGAINSGARVVLFPALEADYLVNPGLVGVSKQIWRGDGANSSILKLAAVPTSTDMIDFNGKTDIQIRDLGINWDNKEPEIYAGAIGFVNCTDVLLERVNILHGYRFGVVSQGTTRGRLQNCRIERDTPDPTLVSSAVIFTVLQSYDWRIIDCDVKKWGIGNEYIEDLITHGLIIDGFAYGSGISGGGADTAKRLLMYGNIIRNGSTELTDLDLGGLRSGGIETYAPDSLAALNLVYLCGGDGIHQAGARSVTAMNVSINNGTRSLVPGAVIPNQFANYVLRNAGEIGDAVYSAFVGNVSGNQLGSAAWSLFGVGNPHYLTIAGNGLNAGVVAPIDLGDGAYKSFSGTELEFSTTWNPPPLAPGAAPASVTFTAVGAQMGDTVAVVGFSLSKQGVLMWGDVTSASNVTVYAQNPANAAGTIDLGSGTLTVVVKKNSKAGIY